MPDPAGYAHAATLATGDPDLAVRLAGELREARAKLAEVEAAHRTSSGEDIESQLWGEVDEAREQRDGALAMLEDTEVELREAQEAIQRVRALHLRAGDAGCRICQERWPCPTVATLDPPEGAS